MRSLRYEDPLDRIWIACAERIGLRIVRDPSAYASTDGKGTLQIGTDETLDADDCLAQMIFHELCHSLVEGPDAFDKVDWGLENTDDRHDVRERACLRLQAMLTRPRGLAGVLAPTTDFRAFWDALGPDVGSDGEDPSVALAIQAANRVNRFPWAPHFELALDATASIAQLVGAHAGPGSGTLWERVQAPRPRHPTGLYLAPEGSAAASERCGTCAWSKARGRSHRCVSAETKTKPEHPACERWQPELDCQSCAACCREAFDLVMLGKRERVDPSIEPLVENADAGRHIPRRDGLCVALELSPTAPRRFSCEFYEVRPQSCRDFERGSANCLLARRRVGLSR